MRHFKRNIIFISILLFVVTWIILMYFLGPQVIVDTIGVRNGYAIMFLIALLGGVSVFTSTSYMAVLITFAGGGLNPFVLGVLAGAGLAFGDALFFYLGMHGKNIVSRHLKIGKWLAYLTEWIKKQSGWVVPFLIFFYTGFTPFPSDVLSVSLAVAGYPFKKFLLFAFLGSVNFATIIALLAYFFI